MAKVLFVLFRKAGLSHEQCLAELAAAIEDAGRFLDMQRTYALTVEEKTVMGQPMEVRYVR